MVFLLRKCKKCGSYTLQETCPKCGGETTSPHPAKFSMDDRYRKYKILMKRLAEKEE
jgi:H/ACA ribonucleoprotein complex subunit 3